jgi:dihydrofolate reductase
MAFADSIELTRVHANFDGDTYFPDVDPNVWKEAQNIFHNQDANHDYNFSFITYTKR